MPKALELKELNDSCKWEYTTINGASGYKVIGPNNNAIFLPIAGHRGNPYLGASHFSYYGCYWSSTMDWGPFEDFQFHSSSAYCLQFGFIPYGVGYIEGATWNVKDRSFGFTVRAVQ